MGVLTKSSLQKVIEGGGPELTVGDIAPLMHTHDTGESTTSAVSLQKLNISPHDNTHELKWYGALISEAQYLVLFITHKI